MLIRSIEGIYTTWFKKPRIVPIQEDPPDYYDDLQDEDTRIRRTRQNHSQTNSSNPSPQLPYRKGTMRQFLLTLAANIQKNPSQKEVIFGYCCCSFISFLRDLFDKNQLENDNQFSNPLVIIIQLFAQDLLVFAALRVVLHTKLIRLASLYQFFGIFTASYILSTGILMIILLHSTIFAMLICIALNGCIIFSSRNIRSNNLQRLNDSLDRFFNEENTNRNINLLNEDQQEVAAAAEHAEHAEHGVDGIPGAGAENPAEEDILLLQRRRNQRGQIRSLLLHAFDALNQPPHVIQLISLGSNQKTLMLIKYNEYTIMNIYQRSHLLSTKRFNVHTRVLRYYSNIGIGVIVNTHTQDLDLFTVSKQLSSEIKIVKRLSNVLITSLKHQTIMHETLPKLVSMRLNLLVFYDILIEEKSSQSMIKYQNRVLKYYGKMHDTDSDYLISVDKDELIIQCIMSKVKWSPFGDSWERELEEKSNSFKTQQYFIQDKTIVRTFDTDILSVQILNKRRIIIGEQDKFSVYSVPTKSMLQEINSMFLPTFVFTQIDEVYSSGVDFSAEDMIKLQSFLYSKSQANTTKRVEQETSLVENEGEEESEQSEQRITNSNQVQAVLSRRSPQSEIEIAFVETNSEQTKTSAQQTFSPQFTLHLESLNTILKKQ